MDFFEQIKRRLRYKNMLWLVLFWLLAIGGAAFAVAVGTSADATPAARMVMTTVGGVLAALFALGGGLCLKAFMQSPEHAAMMAQVAALGDAAAIGDRLTQLSANPYAKGGELRFDDYVLFYRNDADITVMETASIQHVRTETMERKAMTEHYVCIRHHGGTLKIRVGAHNAAALTAAIAGAAKRARGEEAQ